MKKSKILAISLGSVALTTLAISTPLVLTSCTENSKPVELVKNNLITLKNEKPSMKLSRIENTNNFEFFVGENKLSLDQYTNNIHMKEDPKPTDIFELQQLKKLGFDTTKVKEISLEMHVTDFDGKNFNESQIIEKAIKDNKGYARIKYNFVIKGKTKENTDHTYTAVVLLTMQAKSK